MNAWMVRAIVLAAILAGASAHAQGYPDGFGQMWIGTTAMGSAMKDAAGAAEKVVQSPRVSPRTTVKPAEIGSLRQRRVRSARELTPVSRSGGRAGPRRN